MPYKFTVTGKFSYYTCDSTITIRNVESNQIERVMAELRDRFTAVSGGEPEHEAYTVKPDYRNYERY